MRKHADPYIAFAHKKQSLFKDNHTLPGLIFFIKQFFSFCVKQKKQYSYWWESVIWHHGIMESEIP